MRRREMLRSTGAAVLGLSTFPLGWVAAEEKKKQPKVLYFTRSTGYEHSVVKRDGDRLSYSERILTDLGKEHGVVVDCTKDGRVFDGDLDQYDAIAFYNCGNPDEPAIDGGAPISPNGKRRLLEAIAAGKGFVGIHSACYCYYSTGPKFEIQTKVDPYVTMLGGEFVQHGQQQEATARVVSPEFPGVKEIGESFRMVDEWYGLKNFARDLHVILVLETEGMKRESPVDKESYDRPPFPCTWARMQDKGRVFYTAMGHREDVWDSRVFQQILLGGFAWAMGRVDADITPNLDRVAPKASQLRA